jgi:rhodanese-related sulfurtransferase
MLKKILLCSAIVYSSALLPAQSALAEESSATDPIPQQMLLDYLAGKGTFTLLDARSTAEYQAGHIYGAHSMPHDSDLNAGATLPADLNSPLVVYCKSGLRAEALQQSLLAKGYTDVRVLYPQQMLWADELPVFNCGATVTTSDELTTVDAVALAAKQQSSGGQ